MLNKLFQFFTKKKRSAPNKLSRHIPMLEQVHTKVQNLRTGMYVAELDRPWTETSFKFQGFLIETEKDLLDLRNTCAFVYIDTTRSRNYLNNKHSTQRRNEDKAIKISEPIEKLGSFEQEIERAEKTYHNSKVFVSELMSRVANGGGIDTALAKDVIADCVNSVLHSPDAFIWLSQLKSKDNYTAQHSLNVSVLSIILGRQIGLEEKQLNQVALCGMMHDMGKMLVPLNILNKPGKLGPDELNTMQKHTILGHELLSSSDNMFQGAIETALTHHERVDGKGYPKGIPSNSVSYFSNIVTVADIYDAITSDRVYQKGRTHLEAIKILFEVSGSQLNQQLAIKFIESLSVYPPGSFVKLSNGSIAMILEINIKLKLRPKILLILDKNMQSLEDRVIDLTKTITDIAGNPLSISNIIKPDDYSIKASSYFKKSTILNSFSMQ